MADDERRKRRTARDINWGLIAGRRAIERDETPPLQPSAEQPKRVCKTYGPSCPTCHPSPAQAVVNGALARAEALAAGHPDWMNVTQWPLDAPQPGRTR